MKNINILGCCILRDVFRIADKEQKYKVNKFYQSVSPLSITESPPKSLRITPEDLSAFGWSNFVKRNVCADFNKNIVSVYSENTSDFLIIDLCELRFEIVTVTLKDGQKFYLTKTIHINELLENIDKVSILDGANIEYPTPISDDVILECLTEYMAFLKKSYSEKNIILVRNVMYYKGIDEEKKCFFEFHNRNTLNQRKRLNKFYDYIEQLCPEINVIRMPDNCLCYAQHLWGKSFLHFCDEYYIYLYKAIEVICNTPQMRKCN